MVLATVTVQAVALAWASGAPGHVLVVVAGVPLLAAVAGTSGLAGMTTLAVMVAAYVAVVSRPWAEVRPAVVAYPNGLDETDALASVSIALRPGSFTAIMGPSGSGKSTFLNCAAGLDRPTSGHVVVGDVDLTTLRPDALTQFRRRHIGFVFQAYNLVGHLTVAQNVQLPLLLTA